MKVLIIGLGSIAAKHINALNVVSTNNTFWALRSKSDANSIPGVINIYKWTDIPNNLDFVIISNITSRHIETIRRCIELKVPLFIEKPPFDSMEGTKDVLSKIEKNGIRTYTAFNFRFNPLIQWLKNNLVDKRIIEIQIYCGSYLPEWRPGRDYRKIYSAHEDLGGGVHLDLIHELDYTVWLFGSPQKLVSRKRKASDLEINSFDFAQYWLDYKDFNVTISLNYYRRDPKRQIEIVMHNTTWTADLLKSQITDFSGQIIFEDLANENTYVNQMRYFLKELNSGKHFMNDLADSTKLLENCLS